MQKREWIFFAIVASIPDIALAWLYMTLSNGGAKEFWIGLGALYALQFFLWCKNSLAAWLAYRVRGRRRLIQLILDYLRSHNLPPSRAGEDALGYLDRIANDESYTVRSRIAAACELAKLQVLESQGVLSAMRALSAYDEAVEKYR